MKLVPIELALMFLSNITYLFWILLLIFVLKLVFRKFQILVCPWDSGTVINRIPLHAFWRMLPDTCNQIIVTWYCLLLDTHYFTLIRIYSSSKFLYRSYSCEKNQKVSFSCFYLHPDTWWMLPKRDWDSPG